MIPRLVPGAAALFFGGGACYLLDICQNHAQIQRPLLSKPQGATWWGELKGGPGARAKIHAIFSIFDRKPWVVGRPFKHYGTCSRERRGSEGFGEHIRVKIWWVSVNSCTNLK